MKDFQSLLLDGKAAAARVRLSTIARSQPGEMARIAAEAADSVAALYDRFKVAAVHEFCSEMEMDLPEPIANAIDRRMKTRIERTKYWLGELPGITQERLARECRRAIVTRDYKEAARLGAAMLEMAEDQEGIVRQARYLALALATLYHDRDRVPQVIGQIAKCGGRATAGARHISEQFAILSRQTGQDAFDAGERQWRQRLTEAVVRMQAALPGPMEADSPRRNRSKSSPSNAWHPAGGLAQGQIEHFVDALILILDYCRPTPRASPTSPASRPHVHQARSARQADGGARHCGLGQNPVLRKGILELARAPRAAAGFSS